VSKGKTKFKAQRRDAALHLKAMLLRNRDARDAQLFPANLDKRLRSLQAWQARRLDLGYNDLRADKRFRKACDFFTKELYGDQDFSKRDRDVERIYPIMIKLLPAQVLGTVARAVELNAVSHELDLQTVAALPASVLEVDDASYMHAYTAGTNEAERRRQLALILVLGRELARLVKKPMMSELLRLCRWPAKLAGLGELQLFLERGFAAFVAMDGARDFMQQIRHREMAFMRRLHSH
jgi:hypothetical protein